MANSLGDIIRDLRKSKKITQEELADGICSSVSISRIENGTQMPSGSTLEKILAKLGASTYQICNIYYKNERQQKFEELAQDATDALNRGDLDYAKSVLEKLHEYDLNDASSKQMVSFINGVIMYLEKKDGARELLEEALSFTKPDFDFANFHNLLLSLTEANIIGVIAAAYVENGDVMKAVIISKELLAALKNQKSEVKGYGVSRVDVAMNLATCLLKAGSCGEAFDVISETERWAISNYELTLMPELEYVKATVLHQCGRKEEAKKIIDAIVPYMKLVGKEKMAERAATFAKEHLI